MTTYRTKKIQKKEATISTLYVVTWAILIFFVGTAILSQVFKQRNQLKEPVLPTEIIVESKTIPENNYKISVSSTSNGKEVKIQGYKVFLSEADFQSMIGTKSSVKTAIYVTGFKVPGNSVFQRFFPNQLQVARFTFLGQSEMTEEEKNSTREAAATYLTQARQKSIGEDVEPEDMPSGYSIK